MLKFKERTAPGDHDEAPAESTGPTARAFSTAHDVVARSRSLLITGWHKSAGARSWFGAFRRTRPFWGGLWMIVGGWLIVRLSMVPLQVVVSAGMAGFGGWLTGGGLIVCGLIAWSAPSQRYVAGIIAVMLAIASLVLSNLGGMFVGMLFGVVGAAMVLSWGPKKPRKSARADIDVPPGDAEKTGDVTASAEEPPTPEPSGHDAAPPSEKDSVTTGSEAGETET
ncbi:DUF6114 domain-containing protein [Antrihabitans cavernicola]|uniref:DUF6114 domain-containing protein n=1 Tax=Antrihabitans cavernicola TaxID=2495913 RepID=UPI001659086E|nr:DUF6114 domain-containing protein [Spelaeibacter cavernicola]